MIVHRLIVAADAHFGSAPPADEEAFLAFLDAAPGLGDALLLAGDIYDFWFTYRRVIPRRAARVTAGIIHLARTFPVMMIGGNHDRWGGTFWSQDAGVMFDPWEMRIAVADRPALAVHGDGLHVERPTASFLSRLLASPPVITTFRLMPTELGFRIADRLGHDPSFAGRHPQIVADAAARQLRWAEARLASEPALGALIMGHTHRETALEVRPGQWYLNPGAWLDGHRYATLDHDGATLLRFS